MASTIFSKTIITEPNDNDRTIETQAAELSQQIIAEYYNQNSLAEPNANHDRIILTAAVVIDE